MYHERSWLVSSTLDPVESRVRTGLSGRSCSGLCIQQWMLVNANELPLLSVHWNVALSVLTRDQMSSF